MGQGEQRIAAPLLPAQGQRPNRVREPLGAVGQGGEANRILHAADNRGERGGEPGPRWDAVILLEPKDSAGGSIRIAGGSEDVSAILRPFPAERMVAYPVGRWVNDPRHDDQRCVEPGSSKLRPGVLRTVRLDLSARAGRKVKDCRDPGVMKRGRR